MNTNKTEDVKADVKVTEVSKSDFTDAEVAKAKAKNTDAKKSTASKSESKSAKPKKLETVLKDLESFAEELDGQNTVLGGGSALGEARRLVVRAATYVQEEITAAENREKNAKKYGAG